MYRSPLVIALSVAALTACPSPDPVSDDDDDDAAGPVGVDPIDLGNEVSLENLTQKIQGLEDLGTRYTFGEGDELALAWLVDEVEALGFVAELDPFDAAGETATNLVVVHPGVDPQAVWIYSAHYDSTSNEPTFAAPGADDNASGVAAVLEAARILSRHRFRDEIRFVFTAAEEQGSLGSEHLAAQLAAEPVTVGGVIAPDMIGYWPLGDGDAFDILGDESSEHLVEGMADMADRMGVAYKTWIRHDYCWGDDHTRYQDAGLPALTPMDCVEAHNVPASGEETPHYHRWTDTIDTLHMPFTTRVAAVVTATLAEWAGPQPEPEGE